MRVRDDFLWLGLTVPPVRLARLRADDLAVARYEPVFRDKRGCGMLDLTFVIADDAFALVGIMVDMVALWTLEAPPLIWPAPLAAAIDPAVADRIEAVLLPWLRTLVRGVATPAERIRTYGDEGPFRRARAAGWTGAVPYRAAIVALAPYAYARRFARDARVRIAARDGALGAAYLRDRAAAIALHADLDAADVAWYGVADCIGAGDGAAAEIAIVDRAAEAGDADTAIALDDLPAGGRRIAVPEPVPLDNGFTFDAADAPVIATFGVRAPDRAAGIPPPAPTRRRLTDAEGAIGIVLRPDAGYAPDADTDEVAALRELLAFEGLHSFVTTDPADPELTRCDLVHAIGAYDDRHLAAAAVTAQRHLKPLVIGLEPLAPYANWYEDAFAISVQLGMDRIDRAFYLENYRDRRVAIDTAPLAADPATLRAVRERFLAVARSAKAIVTSDDPVLAERDLGIPAALLIAAGIPLANEPGGLALNLPIPPGPFVFMHAPLVRRSHLGVVLAALATTGIDVVVAGEPADVDTAILLRKVAGREVVFLTDPSPLELAAIYARAAVFIDPSLRPHSYNRLARAARAGALPLVAREGPHVRMVAPDLTFSIADLGGIAPAVRHALDRSDRAMRAKRLAYAMGPMIESTHVRGALLAAYARGATAPVQASR